MAQPVKPLFAVENLACRRAERVVFRGLGFALEPGAALVLRGPNGSGKSSLLRLLAGLGRAEAGTIHWAGEPVVRDWPAHRARLHFIGHQDAIKPALAVAEVSKFWAGMRGGTERVDEALAHFRLTRLTALPCRLLSEGEKKRVSLSRLLASEAPLWLLDEPTAGLDAAAEADLARAIAVHRAEGGIVVVATHVTLDLLGAATLSLADFAVGAAGRST
jgi:heme exporter protein A